jgi:hypothetical protein
LIELATRDLLTGIPSDTVNLLLHNGEAQYMKMLRDLYY